MDRCIDQSRAVSPFSLSPPSSCRVLCIFRSRFPQFNSIYLQLWILEAYDSRLHLAFVVTSLLSNSQLSSTFRLLTSLCYCYGDSAKNCSELNALYHCCSQAFTQQPINLSHLVARTRKVLLRLNKRLPAMSGTHQVINTGVVASLRMMEWWVGMVT